MSEERDIVLLRIDRKTGILMLGVLAVIWGGFALAEQLTLATSYPAPSGIYNQLITTGNSGSVAADTTFNRNAGNTILVPPTNAGGRVGIGNASPSEKLEVAGNIKAAAFLYSSDARLKRDIRGLDGSLGHLSRLRGVSFVWRDTGARSVGLVAQDVEKSYPELVFTDARTGLKSVNYAAMVAPLIEAVKSQEIEIQRLGSELETVKAGLPKAR